MTFIYFILVLGITILIHELGHFIFAKKAGVHVYEFSFGMGPQLFKFKRKNDETVYSIRLFPIGGFVSMAGEDLETDEKIPKDKQMCNKGWLQRFLIIVAGVVFNFILAIILLFIIAMINGAPKTKPYISSIDNKYPIHETSIKSGDLIIGVNGKKISSVDRLVLELQVNSGKTIEIKVKDKFGKIESYSVKPLKDKYGFTLDNKVEKGFISSVKYAVVKTGNLIEQMSMIIGYLFTGKLSINNLSGPVGIFQIVGSAAESGILNLLFLISYLCINVGFINLIPIPAFDGGRLLFLIIEKIKGSKVSPKVENMVHSIGFILLMLLMVIVTFNDVLRLFK